MYRTTARYKKRAEICRTMRAAKEEKRLASATERPAAFQPPMLRRVVIVIDYDLGISIDTWRLYRTNRIDSYRTTVNDIRWRDKIGWSGICKALGVSHPRLLSQKSD